MEDFENQINIFELYSTYSEDVRFGGGFVVVTCFLAEHCFDESDVLGTLILHWYVG